MTSEEIKKQIFDDITKFYKSEKSEKFVPGETKIQYSGFVMDEKEIIAVLDALMDKWLGLDKRGTEFERMLTEFIGGKSCILTNSGSSASLVSISSLKEKLGLKPKDEIIVPACSFPTTVNPIVQNGLRPVFIDCELGTYNATPEMIEAAITEKTKALIFAHTLGNPYEMDSVMELIENHNLYFIEDCCDALGSMYKNRRCGSFGDMSTYSFYPAHHITMGEGGAIVFNNKEFFKTAKSLRDWGRDCWCKPGVSNTCGKRFSWNFKNLPKGYDHKYIFTLIGYNLKPTELQAALGIVQLKKFDQFMKARKRNFAILYKEFENYQDYFILPKSLKYSELSWFSFPLTIKDCAPFNREKITGFLEKNKIGTRVMFSGNITKQPAYENIDYRVSGSLENSDKVMRDSFFLGIYPGIDEEKMNYILEKIREFIKGL